MFWNCVVLLDAAFCNVPFLNKHRFVGHCTVIITLIMSAQC